MVDFGVNFNFLLLTNSKKIFFQSLVWGFKYQFFFSVKFLVGSPLERRFNRNNMF